MIAMLGLRCLAAGLAAKGFAPDEVDLVGIHTRRGSFSEHSRKNVFACQPTLFGIRNIKNAHDSCIELVGTVVQR